MGTVEHMGRGAGRISGDLGDLIPSPAAADRARRSPPSGADPVRTAVRTFGEVLITLGLVVLLFVVYEVYWTDVVSAGKQRDATSALDDRWKGGEDPQRQDHFSGLGEGDGFAKMYIPAFGADYHFTIVEGTTAREPRDRPRPLHAHRLPGRARQLRGRGAPGRQGRAVQRHQPDQLLRRDRGGDPEQLVRLPRAAEGGGEGGLGRRQGHGRASARASRCSAAPYSEVIGQQIVPPTDGSVVAPVPGSDTVPSVGEQASLMTLTTCHPRFSDKERLIVHAVLVRRSRRIRRSRIGRRRS